jgi:hypothetical protein
MTGLVFRTNDYTRWGTGQGSNLSAAQVDVNFWILYSALTSLQDHALTNENQIDYFSVVGNQLYVTMMNHEVFGPYLLPVAAWNFRGPWTPLTPYSVMDVITHDGAVYLVIFAHTSFGAFIPGANDGAGHNFYGLLLEQPQDELPYDGLAGQVLTVLDAGSPTGTPVTAWENPTRVLALFVVGAPQPSELLLQYVSPEQLTFLVSLVGSAAYCETDPTVEQEYLLYQNTVFVGSINFSPSPPGSVTFYMPSQIVLAPGDVLTLNAPVHPDIHMTNISFSLVGLVGTAA